MQRAHVPPAPCLVSLQVSGPATSFLAEAALQVPGHTPAATHLAGGCRLHLTYSTCQSMHQMMARPHVHTAMLGSIPV